MTKFLDTMRNALTYFLNAEIMFPKWEVVNDAKTAR